MDLPTSISLSSLLVSAVALVLSLLTTRRQLRIQNATNHVPALLEMLQTYKDPEFQADINYIRSKLAADAPQANMGLDDLPEGVRAKVNRVAYLYQTLAYMTFLGVIDETFVLGVFGNSLTALRKVISPYVEVDRGMDKWTNSLRSWWQFAVTDSVPVTLSPRIGLSRTGKRFRRSIGWAPSWVRQLACGSPLGSVVLRAR
jgi:hypothetical protein